MASRQLADPDGLKNAIDDTLKVYQDEIQEQIEAIVNDVSEEMLAEIVSAARGYGFDNIAKNATLATNKGGRRLKRVWHVKAPHHRFVHLVENGHYIAIGKNKGRRSRAYKFIAPAEEKAVAKFEKLVKEAIENG